MKKAKNAFTLIEVMVAVVIISTVIMGLIQMYSNNTHIFSSLKKQTTINGYSSLLIGNKTYGFEDDEIPLNRLVENFDLETDLRRKLKDIKIKIVYQELQNIDLSDSEQSDEIETEASSEMAFEIGKSIIKTQEASAGLIRLRLQ